MLALVVAPLSLTEDVPFNGIVATFAATDIQEATSNDIKPSISWGDGTTTTSAEVVPDGPNFDIVASKTYNQFGTFPVAVTVTGLNNTSAFGTGKATVADAPLTPTGTTFTATAGQAFNGVVASFLDVSSSSTGADFAVTINWGDGQTSTGTAVAATSGQTGAIRYNVTGTHVYAAAGTDPVTVTIVRAASGQTVTAASTANVINPVLTLTGATFTETLSAPPPSTTSTPVPMAVTVATLIDSSRTSTARDFTATVQWGPGLPTTTGAVTAVAGALGVYTVTGMFNYPAAGVYHPVVTVVRNPFGPPVSTTATGFVSAPVLVGLNPGLTVNFTGGLDPLSTPRLVRGIMVTDQQEPVVSGTAPPGATIRLSFRRLGLGDPIELGETQADPNGRWSLIVGPLAGPPFLLYGVETPVAGPPSPITLLNGGVPIYVTHRSLHTRRGGTGDRGRLGGPGRASAASR